MSIRFKQSLFGPQGFSLSGRQSHLAISERSALWITTLPTAIFV